MDKARVVSFRILLATVLVSGCTSTSNREVRFQAETGLTWASLDEAVVLARAAPQYALAARDYIYLGPVETNRVGELEHYLWLGTASTVDRALRGNGVSDVATLLIVADDIPVALPLTRWSPGFETTPYESAVPIDSPWGARVSMDQIQRIARAELVEVHVVSGNGETVRYDLWRGDWTNWREFPDTGRTGGPGAQAAR